jgi:hypothetical protein
MHRACVHAFVCVRACVRACSRARVCVRARHVPACAHVVERGGVGSFGVRGQMLADWECEEADLRHYLADDLSEFLQVPVDRLKARVPGAKGRGKGAGRG